MLERHGYLHEKYSSDWYAGSRGRLQWCCTYQNMGMSFMDSGPSDSGQEGRSFIRIIEECGSDAGFLKVEERINASLNPTNTVIATGGGSVVYGAKAMEHSERRDRKRYRCYLKLSYEEHP